MAEVSKEEVPVKEEKQTLKESIGKAVEAQEAKEAEKKEEKKEPEKKAQEPSEQEKKADEEMTLQGRQLMQALRDPERAQVVIKYLAEHAGYTKVETKKEAEEVKDEVTETLKEALGE